MPGKHTLPKRILKAYLGRFLLRWHPGADPFKPPPGSPQLNGKNPVLFWIETKAGHSAGKLLSKYLEGQADIFVFLFRVFGMNAK